MRKALLTIGLALLAVNAYAGYNPNTPELVAKTKPGVVLIEIFDRDDKPMGLATGWVARSNAGYELVTNAHVLDGGYATKLTTLTGVKLELAEQGEPIEGWNKTIDIAMLRLKDNPILPEIALRVAAGSAEEGEHILVIGNPRGMTGTVSDGMVSANRDDEFQITAPISAGSSGSPVINDKGEVVGMVKAYMKEAQNINMCVPLMHIRLALNNPSYNAPDTFTVPGDHKELTGPSSVDAAIDKAAIDLAHAFAADSAVGSFEPNLFYTKLYQWYDKHNVSLAEVQHQIQSDNERYPNQKTAFNYTQTTVSSFTERDGYRNRVVCIPFAYSSGTGINENGTLNVVVMECKEHNRWWIASVYNN